MIQFLCRHLGVLGGAIVPNYRYCQLLFISVIYAACCYLGETPRKTVCPVCFFVVVGVNKTLFATKSQHTHMLTLYYRWYSTLA